MRGAMCARSGCTKPGVVWYPDAPDILWCMEDDPRRSSSALAAWDAPLQPGRRRRSKPKPKRTVITQCVWCGVDLDASNVTRDHVVPVSRGGSNGANVAPACEPCNSDKGSMTAAEYLQVLRERRE